MRYQIYKGNAPFWSCVLPTSFDKAEIDAECARLEALRAKQNRQCDEAAKTPHFRGEAFMFTRDNEPYYVKTLT